jgi:hypothetical protein
VDPALTGPGHGLGLGGLSPDAAAALLLALGALGLALALYLVHRVRRRLASRRARRRSRRALVGESAAEHLLARAGYDVVDRQVALTWWIRCDDVDHAVELRADLLVERGGLAFVAEVKTGEAAPRLTTAATRRQLLEYRVAYGVDGVLLVDADRGTIQRVEFPLGRVDTAATDSEDLGT